MNCDDAKRLPAEIVRTPAPNQADVPYGLIGADEVDLSGNRAT